MLNIEYTFDVFMICTKSRFVVETVYIFSQSTSTKYRLNQGEYFFA